MIPGTLSNLARGWLGWLGWRCGDPEEPAAWVAQECVDGLGGRGSGEQEALDAVAAERGECIELCLSFHAFGDHGEAYSFGERDDSPDEATAGVVLVEVADEGAVDLDLVDREVSEPGQGA